MSYLTQQAPATIKANEPVTMKTLLMTEKKYIERVRERELCADLMVSVRNMISDWMCLKNNAQLDEKHLCVSDPGTNVLAVSYQQIKKKCNGAW